MSFNIWDFFQSAQIGRNLSEASQASIRSNSNSGDITHAEDRLNTLSLANQAMWELLSKHHGYMESDLLKKMEEIDLRDGIKDGKVTKSHTQECPECSHIIKKRRNNCYWCGANLKGASPFES